MPFLRQSTAQTIRFGPCLDITDGVTEETALTLAQADMRLSKDGGAFAQKSAAGNATHDSDGWYSTSLSITDTGTVGELILNVHQPANMLPVWLRWWVLEEEVYDDVYGASAVGYLKPTTAGRDLDVSAGGEAGIDWANVGSPTTAVDLSGTDIQLVDTVTTYTSDTPQTGDNFARLGAPAGASVSADVAAVKVETLSLDGTKIPDTLSLANINAEADTALTDFFTSVATLVNLIWDEAMVETTGAPAITGTMRAFMEWWAGLSRNKMLQTATTSTLRDDADGADLATSTVSDDGTTFTRGEWST